jgi:hypothetical protein
MRVAPNRPRKQLLLSSGSSIRQPPAPSGHKNENEIVKILQVERTTPETVWQSENW